MRARAAAVAVIGSIAFTVSAAPTYGAPIFSIEFDDPGGIHSGYYSAIEAHSLAAGNAWGDYFAGNANLEVVVGFSTLVPRATGRSLTSSFVGTNGTVNVFEMGAAAELRTGLDPNGADADIEFIFNPTYLSDVLWFDPNPEHRTASIPLDRTDAVSVFLHEYGHAFGFNGWRDPFSGALPGDYESPYDALTVFDGTNFYFEGSHAMGLYGGPVPLTFGNISHVGNDDPGPGVELIPDLMNGVVFFHGTRYHITPLDLAILSDTGVEIRAIPEPATLTLVTMALVGGAWHSRRKTKTRSHVTPT